MVHRTLRMSDLAQRLVRPCEINFALTLPGLLHSLWLSARESDSCDSPEFVSRSLICIGDNAFGLPFISQKGDVMLKLKRTRAQFPDFDEPMRAENETVIHATPEAIYEKLDLASPKNALRQRGFAMKPGTAEDSFIVTDPRLPDDSLVFDVISQTPPREYAVQIRPVPTDDPTKVKETTRIYQIEQRVDRACRVVLSEITTFSAPLSRDRYVLERASQGFSVFRTLARLKLHIELGLEAASFD